MRKIFVRILNNDGKTQTVYDLNKVSEIFKEGDEKISIIIDGVREYWCFSSKEDRDRNFNQMEEALLKLN